VIKSKFNHLLMLTDFLDKIVLIYIYITLIQVQT
jgi:hypothetical protein